MALAEVCGINQELFKREAFDTDHYGLCENFTNNLSLALPPFGNVSCHSSSCPL